MKDLDQQGPEEPEKKTGKDDRSGAARAARRDGAPDSEDKAANDENPSREEVISRQRDPVTNQDEQEKITNSGDDDIPVPQK